MSGESGSALAQLESKISRLTTVTACAVPPSEDCRDMTVGQIEISVEMLNFFGHQTIRLKPARFRFTKPLSSVHPNIYRLPCSHYAYLGASSATFGAHFSKLKNHSALAKDEKRQVFVSPCLELNFSISRIAQVMPFISAWRTRQKEHELS